MRAQLVVSSLVASAVVFACSSEPTKGPEAGARDKQRSESPASATVAAPPQTCGNGTCDETESCESCSQDCGACTVCPLARSCKTGGESPSSLAAAPSLNINLKAVPRERILADLMALAANGHLGLALLAEALEADATAPPVLVDLRRTIERNPQIAGTIRRALAREEIVRSLAVAHLDRAAMAPTVRAPTGPMEVMSDEADAGADAAVTSVDGKAVKCDAPKLRMRVASVTAKELDDDIAGDIIFCSVAARSRAVQNPVRIIPKTPNLNSDQTHTYTPSEATFWGIESPTDPNGELEIRYDCFEEDSPKGYEEFIKTMTAAVKKAGGTFLPAGYGWVGTAVDLVGQVLPMILALDSDDHLLSASQVIPRSEQMKLVAGAKWSVRQKGTHLWSDWDWRLDIEAYGCTDNGTAP